MKNDYLKHVYEKAIAEMEKREQESKAEIERKRAKMENTFKEYFSLTNEYFNQANNGVAFLSTQPKEVVNFYHYLIAMSNADKVAEIYNLMKNSITKEDIYIKDYWHLTDGYLSQKNENFAVIMNLIDILANSFREVLLDLYNEREIKDFEKFLQCSIGCVGNILKQNDDESVDLSSYQFVELTILKQIYFGLNQMLKNYHMAQNIVNNLHNDSD